VAVLTGAASVTASSAGTWTGESTQYDPVNAFDRNPATAWAESSPRTPVGQWIQITFGHSVNLPARAGIELLDDTYLRSIANQLLVTTAAGRATTNTVSTGADQPLLLPAGPTKWLRITITGASNVVAGYPGAGITDVLIPGVRVTSYLQPAEDPAGEQAPAVAYSFAQPAPAPYGEASPPGTGDLDRVFVTPAASQLTAHITALPEPGSALAALLTRLSPATKKQFVARASSSWNSLPEFGPDNLFENAARMPWLAGSADSNPTVELSWHGRRTIRKLVVQPALGLATEPTGVIIGSPAGARLASVGLGGVVRVSPALRTDRLYLSFSSTSSAAAGNTAAGQPAQLPIGLAKVTVPALAGLHLAVPKDSTHVRLACGQGPAVTVDGTRYQTAVSATIGDLMQLKPVQVLVCSPGGALTLPAGKQQLTAVPSRDFTITGLSLSSQLSASAASQPEPHPGAQSRKLDVVTWQADSRALRIGAGPASYVEIHENFNPGWTATMGGRKLTAVTLDGWQQAFIVPAGHGGSIALTFTPASIYHDGIIASAVALLALTSFAIGTGWLRRRRRVPAGTFASQRPAAAATLAGQPATSLRTRARAAKSLLAYLPLAAVIFVAGGPIVLAVPVLAVVANWRPRWLPAVAAGAMLAAGIVAAAARIPTVAGSGPFSGPAQVCALVALSAALMPAIAGSQRP
jgi:arabinofuranan 3-O-arabinosyltransferase